MSLRTLLTAGSATALALALTVAVPIGPVAALETAAAQDQRPDWRQNRGERSEARQQRVQNRQSSNTAPAPAPVRNRTVQNRPNTERPVTFRDVRGRTQERVERREDRRTDWRQTRTEDRGQDRRTDGRQDRREDVRVEQRDGRQIDRRADRRADRRTDWRTNRETYRDGRQDEYRDGRRDERRTDWRDDRRDSRSAYRNGYRDTNRYSDNRRYDNHRRWDRRAWRSNQRYNWYNYRHQNRNIFRLGRYYAPYRGYSYRRLSIGFSISSGFYGSRYWINNPWSYRLPEVYGPYRWVRYYDDVLLVNVYSGEVVDVIYDFFW